MNSNIVNFKRRDKDIMKLMLSRYDVKLAEGKSNEFWVTIEGPKNSPYEDVYL